MDKLKRSDRFPEPGGPVVEIIMDGVIPDLPTLMWWGLGSGAVCLLLMLAYKRLRYIYPRIVME